MEATTISSKFQVVIPLKIRERYNLTKLLGSCPLSPTATLAQDP